MTAPQHLLATILCAKDFGFDVQDLAFDATQAATTKIDQVELALFELAAVNNIHVFAVLFQLLGDLAELLIRAVVVFNKLGVAQPRPKRRNLIPACSVGLKVFFQLPQ